MVQVSVEVLGGVAVTVLLMLVFLGVVVLWDVALALRDVAEKIDSLEDDVEADLGTIDGTLTRIHDSMRGNAQAGTNGAAAPNAATGATADARSPAGGHQPWAGAGQAPGPNAPAPGTAPTADRGVQPPTGGLGTTRPSAEGTVGGVQLADTRRARAGQGVDARSASVDEFGSDADDVENPADGTDDDDLGVGDTEDVDGADDDAGAADGDAEAADEDEDGNADAADGDDTIDGPDAPGPTGEQTDGAVEPGEDDGADAAETDDDAADDVPEADDALGALDPATPDGPGADSEDDDAEAGATEAGFSGDGTGALDAAELDGSVAQLLDDGDPDEDVMVPDDSATEAVRTFGQDARTNRGLGPAPDLFADAIEADAEPTDGEVTGRFAAEEGAWYATEFETHPRATDAATDADAPLAGGEPDDRDGGEPEGSDAGDGLLADESVWPADGDPDADGDTDPVDEDSTDDIGPLLDDLGPDADAETTAAAAIRQAEHSVTEDVTSGVEDVGDDGGDDDDADLEPPTVDVDADDEVDTDGGVLDEAVGAEGPEDDGPADDAPDDDQSDEPSDVGDLVERELTTLTEEVGGTSLSPDVSSMSLPRGADELDGTTYTFPLSGASYELVAEADQGTARLELMPDDPGISVTSQQLLRYQFRSYLGQEESVHAELTVDDDGVIAVEIPGATAESLDAWADALIQITDRTMYLGRAEE